VRKLAGDKRRRVNASRGQNTPPQKTTNMPTASELKKQLEAARAERLRLEEEAAAKEAALLREVEESERREEEARKAAAEEELRRAQAVAAIRAEVIFREQMRTLREAEEVDKASGRDKLFPPPKIDGVARREPPRRAVRKGRGPRRERRRA
jgi:hypothetical protein